MPIILNRRSLSALAKLDTGGLKHTERLSLFAKTLGFPDQTAMMAQLKAEEGGEAVHAPQVQEAEISHEDLMKRPMDDLVADILTARLSRLRDEPGDPWPRSEWRDDVLRGDSSQGFEEWHASQIESYCEQIRIHGLICDALRFNLTPEERQDLIRRFAETMELLEVMGGAEALGERIFHNLEWLQECVEVSDEGPAWQADETDIMFQVQVVGAWKERNAERTEEPTPGFLSAASAKPHLCRPFAAKMEKRQHVPALSSWVGLESPPI